MAVLNILAQYSVTKPSGMWEALLGLFDFIANYGWRVILFTVLLKLVLSPLDFFQKYKMRKNQRISQMLKPEMDRLQKQYAHDKASLQQAQMKMQRASGFSHFYSCIPMLLTLVIFFTFWAGMRNIAPYEEFKQYVELYGEYSGQYQQLTGLDMAGDGELVEGYDDGEFRLVLGEWEKGELTAAENDARVLSAPYHARGDNWYQLMYEDWQNLRGYVQFFNANPVYPVNAEDYADITGFVEYVGENGVIEHIEKPFLRSEGTLAGSFDIDAVLFGGSGAKTAAAKGEIRSALNSALATKDYGLKYQGERLSSFASFDDIYFAYNYLDDEQRIGEAIAVFLSVADTASAEVAYEYFLEHRSNFLWIKSVWVADVPWKNAIPSFGTFSKSVSDYFKSSKYLIIDEEGLTEENIAAKKSAVLGTLNNKTTYDKIMLKIRADEDVSGFNGLLLLGVIAVGLSVLSQFITTRQQKKSGQIAGAGMGGSMKMMYMIMPIITGVMAVMYTATFAVYMVTNSIMTLGINLLSTFVIGFVFKLKNKEEVSDTGIIKYGRRDPNDKINKGK